VAQGALLADSLGGALRASPLTIICVSDYQSLQLLFATIDAELDGRLLVNLTSGDSAQANETAQWAAQRGARYLDGAIMADPPAIGTPEAVILLSGTKTDFETNSTCSMRWAPRRTSARTTGYQRCTTSPA
jgi:3-hydroxyisobutyrate dehydrogenase-like beta-hydroxyacid dehydrogenase